MEAIIVVFSTIIGGAAGTLVSFFFRPTLDGRGPTLDVWLTKGLADPAYQGTILVCVILGLAMGLCLGIFFCFLGRLTQRSGMRKRDEFR